LAFHKHHQPTSNAPTHLRDQNVRHLLKIPRTKTDRVPICGIEWHNPYCESFEQKRIAQHLRDQTPLRTPKPSPLQNLRKSASLSAPIGVNPFLLKHLA
ncbi:MAG TPA: hypothetical protein VF646_14655, partial [Cytophagales bacterium]